MDIKDKNIYSEVSAFLKLLDEEYVKKIPQKMLDFFENNKNEEYLPDLKKDVPITEQDLSKEAVIIISKLNLQYWVKDDAEKQELIKLYTKNDSNK